MKTRLLTLLLTVLLLIVFGSFAWAGTKVQLTTNPATDYGPRFSPDGSKIVFFSNRTGNLDIFMMDADGGNEVQLTTDPSEDLQPHFSPDGTRIVFRSSRSGYNNIWVMNVDGSHLTQLTFDMDTPFPGYTFGADWSPDGTKIVFDTMRSGNHDIWIMDADGSNPVQLTHTPEIDAHPDFSPDGSKIVFWSDRTGLKEVWSMNVDGSNQSQLTSLSASSLVHPHFNHDGSKIGFSYNGNLWLMNGDGSDLAMFTYDNFARAGHGWSPDGSKVAYMSGQSGNIDIWLYDFNSYADNSAIGTNSTQITYSADADVSPNFSPDGSKILFSSRRTGDYEIWTVGADGSNLTQITSVGIGLAGGQPHWSPDGTRIVYRSIQDGMLNIWVMNADGSGNIKLTADDIGFDIFSSQHGQDWSPDGLSIVFDADRVGNNDIWVMNPDGSGQVQLTYDPQPEMHPVFSPDGSRIAYLKQGLDGYLHIWAMNADGSGQVQLTYNSTYDVSHPHFSPDGSKIVYVDRFVGNPEVTIMDANTGARLYQISHNPASDGGGHFSPDGKKIVYRSTRSGNHDIWVYDFESAYISKLNTNAVDCPTWIPETVDINVTSGQTNTRDATGLVDGKLVFTVGQMVDILSGSHQNWRSVRAAYDMGGYTGTLYKIVDALGNGWGVATGDIHAAVRSDGTGGVWHVTSINGQQVDGQIRVSAVSSSTPATLSTPYTTTQNVRTGFKWLGTSTGYYEGPLANEVTVVGFPVLEEGGFAYGTYSSDIGTGSSRAYLDNRDSVTARRYLTYDGALFGNGERVWPVGSYSCYDLAATQRYEHVLAPGLSVDPTYQAASDNLFVSGTGTQHENVDVTVFEGYSNTATATGAISGTRTMQLRKRVDIHSGTYAGWVYKIHTYELNGYRGTTYIISDGIRGRGYATGDINAVIDGSASRWHLTSIKGVPTTGVIEFGGKSINIGTRTDYYGLLLRISSGTHEVSYSGYKDGVNQFYRTAVVIPSLGDGFLHGSYDSPWGSGEAYVYIDNNHAPVMFRKGIAVGPLHGTRNVKGDLPNLFGSTVYEGLWEFVRTDTDGDGTVNSEDFDDDNDGLSDVVENTYNLNPLDPADAQEDPDGDGLTNLQEILLGYSLSLADTDGDGVNDNVDNCPTISNADQSDVCSGSSEVSEIPTPPNPVVSAPPTVTVAPTPDVEITIEAVKTGGTVSVTPLNKPAPPANFKIVTGAAYEINTDVAYDGLITVCLDYQDSALAKAGNEDNLKLFHRSGAGWEDITTTIDTANNQICGDTATLSPFAVGEPEAATPSTSTGVPIMSGWWLLAAVGGGMALLRRRANKQ